MVDDLLYGRVTSFRREQGFGVITLDDGREIRFDASDCTMVPEVGEAVQLHVGPARWGGGLKALQVAARGSSAPVVPARALERQLAALQREQRACEPGDRAAVGGAERPAAAVRARQRR
jgi:hypothetical protein